MSERLWDDGAFLTPGEPMPQPVSLAGLLEDLDLEDAGVERRAQGVRSWLAVNEPNVYLRRSIDRSGLLTTLV